MYLESNPCTSKVPSGQAKRCVAKCVHTLATYPGTVRRHEERSAHAFSKSIKDLTLLPGRDVMVADEVASGRARRYSPGGSHVSVLMFPRGLSHSACLSFPFSSLLYTTTTSPQRQDTKCRMRCLTVRFQIQMVTYLPLRLPRGRSQRLNPAGRTAYPPRVSRAEVPSILSNTDPSTVC